MRPELLLIEKIEQYLEGALTPEETAIFEKQLSENDGLRAEVELQQQIVGGVQRSLIKKEVAAAFIKYKTIALLFKLGIIVSSTAITTIGAVLLFNHLNSTSGLKPAQNINTPPVKEELETRDTVINFIADSITSDTLSDVSKANTDYQYSTNTTNPAVPEKTKFSRKFSADTATKNETPIATTTNASEPPEIIKSSSPSPKLSNKEKKQSLSKFFIDPKAQITWLGIDFSDVRLLEKENSEESEKISGAYFREWNDLVILEEKRYDIEGAFHHNKITYNNSYINSKNDTIQVGRLFVGDKNRLNHLNSNKIQNIINTYPLENKEGYGLVFIVESLDKLKKETNTWVTLIDMKTKQVLITEKMYANAGGVGLRNYWARGFHNTINDIKERKYAEWKSKIIK